MNNDIQVKPPSKPDDFESNENIVKSNTTFQTPEEIAAKDTETTAAPILGKTAYYSNQEEPNMKKRKFPIKWPLTKKQLLAVALIVVLLLGTGGYLGYKQLHKIKKIAAVKTVYNIPPKPITVPSDLTGLPVNPSVNKLPVTAVMIENSLDARPQSGLSQAGVVFEAVAEGGVTRFMAVYQDTAPTDVGPIRSARPYYVAWALGFDASYAHVGGSPDGLADISAWGVHDLNEFYNGSSYHRIASRAAPHNVYTGIPTLNQLEATKGYTSSTYTSWPRTVAAPLKVPTASTINLSLSGPDYNPTFTYDASTNSYNRSQTGSPMIDAYNNTQVSPKVVIAAVIPETSGALDSSGAYYSNYSFVGSGQADIFQNGGVTVGQWTKSSNTSQIMFTTTNSKPLPLVPGQVWITAVTTASSISYTP
jgi:hypothetical protein